MTIFAIAFRSPEDIRRLHPIVQRDAFALRPAARKEARDPLEALTALTGGLVLEGDGHPVAESVARVLRMTRERYIVDFPVPTGISTGPHDLRVRLEKRSKLLVRAAGVGYLTPEPDDAADPNRVPTDHSKEPPFGKRRILTVERDH